MSTTHTAHQPLALQQRKIKHLGWRSDLPDPKDLFYAAPLSVSRNLPAGVDLRGSPFMPPVVDQGQLGSCTANGIAGLHEFVQAMEKQPPFAPSRLFIYWFERYLEGTVTSDSGAMIRDGMKVLSKMGVPPETLCPYDISKFTEKPSDAAIAEAAKHQALVYRRLIGTNPNSLKTCLAAGRPITFGFTVYESFESKAVEKTGVVPMPGTHEQILGGHCVDLVGYDDDGKLTGHPMHYIVRNSWGTGWGLEGYCFMPYTYVNNAGLCSDFWTLFTVEQDAAEHGHAAHHPVSAEAMATLGQAA